MPAIMCDSFFVFGEFILLSVQPVALATPVVKLTVPRSRVSVLRIGSLACATLRTRSHSDASSPDSRRRDIPGHRPRDATVASQ